MKAPFELPPGYGEIHRVDFMADPQMQQKLMLPMLIIIVALVFIGAAISPLSFAYIIENAWRIPIAIIATIIYIILHELIHGIVIRYFSGKWGNFGFKGFYAYAGSPAYFTKSQHIAIGIAPVLILGIILIALNILLPMQWFWTIWAVQIMNLHGSIGDYYMARLLRRLPPDLLIQDAGVSMIIYSREEIET